MSVDPDDVMIRDFQVSGQPLIDALDLLFLQTNDPELDYVIEKGVLLITTREVTELPSHFSIRTYDVSGLSLHEEQLNDLVTLCSEDPQMWDPAGGGCQFRMSGSTLFVFGHRRAHRVVIEVLEHLMEASH
ncbi:MAG: hypothetical protein KDA96_05715 [Planctomycetaceae bacterium]|nr:hypothetical protein [Planctomycetaceae bacterium]